jgi:5'-nucleotidase
MNILVTNDDGIYAKGLAAIFQELSSLGKVTVVAPESEQSAVGHAISINQPLRVRPVSMNGDVLGWAVSGTPADCVKIALAELLPEPPDLVISGINLGPNVGINVLYSGTVSAATEASILGIKAMAFSLDTYKHADFTRAAVLARQVLASLLDWPAWTPEVCLNVNLPNLPLDQVLGIRFTRQDVGPLVEHFERRVDPRERIYYWLAEITDKTPPDPATDLAALKAGYVSVTPIHHDLTHYPSLEKLLFQD